MPDAPVEAGQQGRGLSGYDCFFKIIAGECTNRRQRTPLRDDDDLDRAGFLSRQEHRPAESFHFLQERQDF